MNKPFLFLWRGLWLLPLLCLPLLLCAQIPGKPNFKQWRPDMRDFARQDSLTPPPAHPIIFTGSSSIRKWQALPQAFPTRPVLNRGFGGSTFPEALHFFDTLVAQYQPRQVFLYEGDNDINAGATPEGVYQDFRRFAERMRQQLPGTDLVFISIKPSLARWALWPKMQQANVKISTYIRQHPRHLHYVEVGPAMLGPDGRPRPELYIEDGLHMTPAGYALWARLLEPYLVKE